MKKRINEDSIKSILNTYNQVADSPKPDPSFFSLRRWKNRRLIKKLTELEEQHKQLKDELITRESELKKLSKQFYQGCDKSL